MTEEEITHAARILLGRIAAEKPAAVYAGRRGLTAGVHGFRPGWSAIFRRVDGRIRLEYWPRQRSVADTIRRFALPPAVEEEAALVLDRV